jgi:hypothetical protein
MLLFAGASLLAQAPQGPPPSVAFNCDFPGSDPAHYGILVFSDGRGSYISDGKLARDADPDQASTLEFTLPKATTARVFDLAQKANYFEGKLEAKKKNLASTGDKTLMYKDSTRSTSATYNYSTLPAVQELTTLFQGLSTTLEFGRRLEFELHYQKLAIDEELKRMEDMSVQSGAAEYAAIAPTLQKIVNDQSVVNAARARAQRMLDSAASGK